MQVKCPKASHWFEVSVGVILVITAAAKATAAFGSAGALSVPDPIFHLQFNNLLFLVGIVEMSIAGACFLSRTKWFTSLLIAWLATSCLVYRLGLWWVGWQGPCRCLGSLTDALSINPKTADTIATALLVYLIGGSFGWLVCHCWQGRFATLTGRVDRAKADRGAV